MVLQQLSHLRHFEPGERVLRDGVKGEAADECKDGLPIDIAVKGGPGYAAIAGRGRAVKAVFVEFNRDVCEIGALNREAPFNARS